jgi:LSD1 subclass zinc finger protein
LEFWGQRTRDRAKGLRQGALEGVREETRYWIVRHLSHSEPCRSDCPSVRNLLMVPSGTRRLKATTEEVSVNEDRKEES